MRAPRAVRPGGLVSIVAPAGPVPEARFRAGLARLEARYRVRWSPDLFRQTGYLAGDDATRLAELTAALSDDSTAIVCARGGYGATRILAALEGRVIDKCLVGFSDVTALHARWQRCGVRSIHGPVVTQLGDLPAEDEATLYALLEGERGLPCTGLRSEGARSRVEGLLLGGNLELVTRLIGTRDALELRGNVLLLEEIGERPYRLDRQATHLITSGALDGVAAIVIGDLVRCEEDGMPAPEAVLRERFAPLNVPLLFGLPVGHGTRNHALALGARVRVDGTNGTLEPLEPATQGSLDR